MDEAIKTFDASLTDGRSLRCIVCEREIHSGNWFARIKVGDRRVALCRPQCVEILVDDAERYAWRFRADSIQKTTIITRAEEGDLAALIGAPLMPVADKVESRHAEVPNALPARA